VTVGDKVVVLFESLTGNTQRAAERIGGAAVALGAQVWVRPIDGYDPKELAEADVVFVGTWVDGLILFGHRPGRAGRIKALPALDRKRAAAFCTYAVNPGKTIDKLAGILEANGAVVVAQHAFKRNRIEADVDAFVESALAAEPASNVS
jgi:sulfite reductase alpha subunit-like flavoprotein